MKAKASHHPITVTLGPILWSLTITLPSCATHIRRMRRMIGAHSRHEQPEGGKTIETGGGLHMPMPPGHDHTPALFLPSSYHNWEPAVINCLLT